MMGVPSPSSSSRTSSPVAVGSPTDSQTSGNKRKRASKPKVRTGCITCKIRRVKCGEEKPACVRCTSTGRACDGYDKGVPPRNRTLEFQRSAETAKLEFIKAYQWNEALRSMRPIAADIDGTDPEKKFFRRFRLMATSGLTNHVCKFTQFWNRVTPQINVYDEAVKHAVIALGAAYQTLEPCLNEQPTPEQRSSKGFQEDSADEFTHEILEVFLIQQYNKSISKLQRHVGSSSPDSIKTTLLCCLAFICLETLRGHHDAAVTHLINGLNILQSIPMEHFEFLADLSDDISPEGQREHPFSAQCDMRDIIDLFGCLEISACFFATGLRPIVAERGYAHRKYDDGTSSTYSAEIYCPRQAHRAYSYFLRDVLSRLYETSQEPPTSPLWSDPRQQRQQECLYMRAAKLDVLIRQYLGGPYAPAPDTDDYYYIYLDLLQFRTAQLLLAEMDERLSLSRSQQYGASAWGYRSHLDYPLLHLDYPSSPSDSSSSSYSGRATPPSSIRTSPPPPSAAPLSNSTLPRGPDAQWLQSEVLNIEALLSATTTAQNMRQNSKERIFFNDAGTVGPAYLVAITATDPTLRSRALRLLAGRDGLGVGDASGFFWDGPGLRERLGLMVDPVLWGGLPVWHSRM